MDVRHGPLDRPLDPHKRFLVALGGGLRSCDLRFLGVKIAPWRLPAGFRCQFHFELHIYRGRNVVQFQAELTPYRGRLAASDNHILAVRGRSLGFQVVHRWIAAQGLAMTGGGAWRSGG